MALNKVILIGNMTADPEIKQTQSGTSVCSFNIAVNRYSKEPDAKKVDFFTVVAWQQKAEFVSRYFKKGQAILVCGRLENREWTDKQGNKRISTEIIAEEISFAGSGSGTSVLNESPVDCQTTSVTEPKREVKGSSYMPSAYTQNSQNFEAIATDDEPLPF
jgi:single-strand DNA-binding protein